VCTKTVYPMDQLSTDGVVFHRSCFKCQHCKSTLSVRPLLPVLLRFSGGWVGGWDLFVMQCVIGLDLRIAAASGSAA
jgi:hypothetical protein